MRQLHVNFYRRALMKGCIHGMAPTADMALEIGPEGGAYLTAMFDTGDPSTSYHRLQVSGFFENLKVEVLAAVSDELQVWLEDEPHRLDSYLADPAVSAGDKAEALTHLRHLRFVNTDDMLLHELEGRYIWIMINTWSAGEGRGRLEGLRLELPRESFTEYMPELYRGDDFFDRFIGIFQSLYLDQERRVEEVPALLDYEATPDQNVEQLAGWLGIENSREILSPAQLRHLIRNIDSFQGGKGTRRTMELLVETVIGVKPRIVEHFQWDLPSMSAANRKLYSALYCENSGAFCVIINLMNRALPVARGDLERLVEEYSVMGSRFRMVYLEYSSNADTHCYLDVNSRLSVPETAAIGKTGIGEDITVG